MSRGCVFDSELGQVDDTALEQLGRVAKLKSYLENRTVWYGIIDGVDSTRLIQAYPQEFGDQPGIIAARFGGERGT